MQNGRALPMIASHPKPQFAAPAFGNKSHVRFWAYANVVVPVADIGSASHFPAMALDDLNGIVVASGTWLYDGAISKRTVVTARNYDVNWATYQADGLLEDGELPAEPGPDGLYYYVSGTGPFPTVTDAKAWTEQAWGPVVWDE